jgi:hypothetical protein
MEAKAKAKDGVANVMEAVDKVEDRTSSAAREKPLSHM